MTSLAAVEIHPARVLRDPKVLESALFWLLVAVMISDLFLGDIDIGPASPRIYLMATALLLLGLAVRKGAVMPLATRLGTTLLASYGLFVAWAFFNRLYRGDEFRHAVESVGSTLLFGFLILLVGQMAIRSQANLLRLAIALAATALLSGGFAVLQWIGFDPADGFGDLLRPEDDRFIYARGLALFSISLSYHLLVGGVVAAGIVLWIANRRLRPSLIGIALLSLLYLALWATLARSAIWTGVLTLAVFALVGFFLPVAGSPRRFAAVALLGIPAGVAAIIAVAVSASGTSQQISVENPEFVARYDLSRATDSSYATRIALARWAWRAWRQSPWIGDSRGYMQLAYPEGQRADSELPYTPSAPHNMFLNSMVFYGGIGTAIILVFLSVMAIMALKTVKDTYREPILGPICASATIGLLAFSLNAQFHNESFVSGSSLGLWLIAMLAIAQKIREMEAGSQSMAPASA